MTIRRRFRNRTRRDRRKALLVTDPIGDALRADAIAYWKMDETSGTRVDATGNGHNATQTNNPSSVSGKISNAIQFDGDNMQYLSVADHADLRGDQDFTFAGWIRPLDAFGDQLPYGGLITKGSGSNEEYGLYISGQKFNASIYADPELTFVPALTFGILSIDTWYFVIVQLTASTKQLAISVNDGQFDTAIAPGTLPSTTGELLIGQNTFEVDYAWADVDELGRWNRILTSDERAYLYNAGTGRTLYP